MPREDAAHWDKRYREDLKMRNLVPRKLLAEYASLFPSGGLILDVAMGLGANAEFLVNHGFRVVGVDISRVAILQAHTRVPQIQAVLGDLTKIRFPDQSFSGAINFYYYQPDLWRDFNRTLKPGGVAIIETLMIGMREIKPDLNPDNLLKPGELISHFSGWDILYHREGWQASDHYTQKSIASLVARKRI